MYGKGKLPLPPPPGHRNQLGMPAPPGTPGPANSPFPPPPYSFPYAHGPPHQQNFTYRTPPVSVPVMVPPAPPSDPAPPVPPPPASIGQAILPPLPVKPVPVQVQLVSVPKPSEEEAVLVVHKDLNSESERVKDSPSLSDMDMEDDDEVRPHGSQSEAMISSPFMEDVSPVRPLTSSPGPTECIIDGFNNNNNNNKASDERLNKNLSLDPFELIQQGYASHDDDDYKGSNNLDDDRNEKSSGKRERSKSPGPGLEERNMKLKRESPSSSIPAIKPTVPNQQLPPPPPGPPPFPQITNIPSIHYPPVPVIPPYQSHSLSFPSHSDRWPRPSPYSAASTNYSTIPTRYNPYASTFESVPPFGTSFGTEYQQPVGSKAYDPLSDSIEPVMNKTDPVPVVQIPDPESGTVKSTEDLEEVAAPDTEPGIVENSSPVPNINTGTDIKPGTNTGKKESRSLKLLKTALAEYVKEALKPAWRQGNISKDAFKLIVKKTVEKVVGSVPEGKVPGSKEKVEKYVLGAQHKVTKLVMGYVDKYAK